jgi:hypothetical protein
MAYTDPFGGFKSPLPFYNPQVINKQFATFNPWQNYNDPTSNAGWNYTSDPYFNAAKNTPKWDLAQTGQNSEDDRARVWRFTMDTLHQQGYDPGSAPAQAVQRAYLNSIQRLKRDYTTNYQQNANNPAMQAKYTWANSPYAGYDQFLMSADTQQTSPTSPDYPGGPPPVDPSGKPLPPHTNPAGVPPGQPTPGAPQPTPPPPPPTPTPPPPPPAGNQGQSTDAYNAFLQSNPDALIHDAFMKQGIDLSRPSPLSAFIKSRYTPLATAAIAAGGLGANQMNTDYNQYIPQIMQMLGSATQRGVDTSAQLANYGNQALGAPNLQSLLNILPNQSDAIKQYAQLQALRLNGMNPMIQSALMGELENQGNQYLSTDTAQHLQNGTPQDPFMQWWNQTPWAKFFQP